MSPTIQLVSPTLELMPDPPLGAHPGSRKAVRQREQSQVPT